MSLVRSPLRPITRPPAYSPLQPRPSGLPKDLLLLWNAKDGTRMRRGGTWSYGYAGNQYDDDGVSVGAVPAIHHDADGNLRGVWGGPAYANLIQNSGFAGANVGTTNPTNWTGLGLGSGITREIVGVGEGYIDWRVSGTATATHYPSLGQPSGSWPVAAAGDVWGSAVRATLIAGSITGVSTLEFSMRETDNTGTWLGATTGLNIKSLLDGRELLVTRTFTHASTTRAQWLINAVISSGATVGFTIRISNPSLVKSPYLFPYVRTAAGSTTSVVSAAGTSSNNGLYLPLSDALTEAFAGDGVNPATCTVAALVSMGVGSAELRAGANTTENFLSLRNNIYSLLYRSNGSGSGQDLAKSYDGTASREVGSIAVTWNAGDVHLVIVQTKADGSQFRVGYRRYTSALVAIDASIVWSAWGDFNGSYDPTGVLRWFYTLTTPLWARHLQIWNRGEVAEADILKWVARA